MLISLFLIQCSSVHKEDKNVLAQINDLTVTTTHFENAFKEYYYRTGQVLKPDVSTKVAILNSQFNTYVLAVYAEDENLNETDEAIQNRKAIDRRVLNEEYLNQVILSNIDITEQRLRDYFLRFNTQLRASHIYAKDKSTIEEYYLRLQNGENFERLASEVFEIPYLAEHGGDIGRFTTDDMDIAFEEAAFSLKLGEISKPVQTAQGYSIIKVTDRVSKPLITENEFNQRRDQLYSYVLKKEKELKTRDHINNFLSNLVFSEAVISDLWRLISNNYEGMTNKSPEFISNLSGNELLIKYDGFNFSINDFKEELLISNTGLLNTIKDENSFRRFIEGVAYRSYLFTEAKNYKIDEQVFVQESINETYLHYLSELANNHLRLSINNTEAELYSEYQINQDLFVKPLEINFARIVLDTEEKANWISNEINSGMDFSSLVDLYTLNNEDRFTAGELGFKSIKDFGFSSTELALLEPGEVSGVIQYSQNEYHLYKCIERIEPKALSFSQAHDLVNEYLIKKKLRSLRDKTIEEVKDKHNATVYLKKLQELAIQI